MAAGNIVVVVVVVVVGNRTRNCFEYSLSSPYNSVVVVLVVDKPVHNVVGIVCYHKQTVGVWGTGVELEDIEEGREHR